MPPAGTTRSGGRPSAERWTRSSPRISSIDGRQRHGCAPPGVVDRGRAHEPDLAFNRARGGAYRCVVAGLLHTSWASRDAAKALQIPTTPSCAGSPASDAAVVYRCGTWSRSSHFRSATNHPTPTRHRHVVDSLGRAGRPVHRADDEVGATLADPVVADAPKVRIGDPLLEMTRTMFDRSGKPKWRFSGQSPHPT